jgi:hypothetical protein
MARDMIEAPLAPVDEKAEVRARWLQELRRQGHRQCVGPWCHETSQLCAIVLLAEIVDPERFYVFSPRALAFTRAGLTEDQIDEVIAMNDGKDHRTSRRVPKRTFAEIADVVEGWFK